MVTFPTSVLLIWRVEHLGDTPTANASLPSGGVVLLCVTPLPHFALDPQSSEGDWGQFLGFDGKEKFTLHKLWQGAIGNEGKT